MPDPRPLPVVFFRTEAGGEPARQWLRTLPAAERAIIGQDLKTLQFRWPLGMPLVRSLGDGLWELRSNLPTRIARCLFYVPRGRIVVLHGFIKKTQKTPTEDKTLALKRKDAHSKAEKK
jgi:phage-related protein